MDSTTIRKYTYDTWIGLGFAAIAGLIIGQLDRSATDVQGPLLLSLLAAFIIGALSRDPAWISGAIVGLGIPLTYLAIWLGTGTHADWWQSAMVLFFSIPAAFGGSLARHLVLDAARVISTTVEDITGLPWYAKKRGTNGVVGAILGRVFILSALPTNALLNMRGQPNAWWVTIIWQVLTFADGCFSHHSCFAAIKEKTKPSPVIQSIGSVMPWLLWELRSPRRFYFHR